MNPQISELVDFYTNRSPKEWFMASDDFDNSLREKYSGLVTEARSDKLDGLEDSATGSLALIILLDQIPRNIFRGSGESYSSDKKAQGVATRAIARNFDAELGESSLERQMLMYMPLMHAEDVLSQIACRALLTNLAARAAEGTEQRKGFEMGVGMANRHLDCVMTVGRFPARNKPMGREDKEADIEWMKSHPTGF